MCLVLGAGEHQVGDRVFQSASPWLRNELTAARWGSSGDAALPSLFHTQGLSIYGSLFLDPVDWTQ